MPIHRMGHDVVNQRIDPCGHPGDLLLQDPEGGYLDGWMESLSKTG